MGILSLLKKIGGSSEISAPMNITKISASKVQSGPPPSFLNIATRYENLNKEAKKIAQSDTTHAKEPEYKLLVQQKEQLDKEYSSANQAEVSMAGGEEQKLKDDMDEMMANKELAETSMGAAGERVSKNVAAKNSLEKHRGQILPRIVQHADVLSEEDRVEASTDQSDDAAKALLAQKKQKVAKQDEKKKKVEKAEGIAGILEKLFGCLGYAAGSVADGIEAASKFRGDTKTASAALQKVYKTQDKAKSATGYTAAGFSVLNLIIAAVDTVRAIIKAGSNSMNHQVDAQERFLDARVCLEKISGAVSNLFGAAAPLIGLVPFLGSALAIGDSGFSIIVQSINLVSNSVHVEMMRRDKKKLWAEIERKRKKYKGRGSSASAGYYDIDPASTREDRKQNKTAVDAKRKQLLQTVFQKRKQSGENLTEKGTAEIVSRNDSKYARANEGLSSRIAELREKHHSGAGTGMSDAQYKDQMHAMEAMELMNRFRTTEKAHKRMAKAVAHNVEDVVTGALKLIASGLKLGGEIAAAGGGAIAIAAGTGLGIAEGGYELLRSGGSKIYEFARGRYGATANKENTRNEMAMMLFDKMVALGPRKKPWSGDFFTTDASVQDYKIREESEGMDYLYSVLRRGLDARVSSLLQAQTSGAMKDSMSSAFSQDGN